MCIHALLRLMRTKLNDRLLKLHKGKWTRHLLGIRNRHKTALTCDASLVTVVQPNKVFAVSGKHSNVYMVEQNEVVPHANMTCPLQCQPCGICVHMFSCNCVDSGLRNTICKHVHLVVAKFSPVLYCKTTSDTCGEEHTSDEMEGITANTQAVQLMHGTPPCRCTRPQPSR